MFGGEICGSGSQLFNHTTCDFHVAATQIVVFHLFSFEAVFDDLAEDMFVAMFLL